MKDEMLRCMLALDPTDKNRIELVSIGMLLCVSGYTCRDWYEYQKASRQAFTHDECEQKWRHFTASAHNNGWETTTQVTSNMSLEDQRRAYVEAVFRPNEIVHVVTRTVEKNGRRAPTWGWKVRAENLVSRLSRCDLDREVGMWIVANPTDDHGRKNVNIVAFRHLVIESDENSVDEFIDVTRDMGLPVSTITTSGNKSAHALVRVDARDIRQYRERFVEVEKAYAARGITIDKSCKNPSRLTRFAGVQRGDQMQKLIATRIGTASWRDWKKHNSN